MSNLELIDIKQYNKPLLYPKDLIEFCKDKINIISGDPIQAFNKTGQKGLKRIDIKGKYCLIYPFVYDNTDVEKRKECSINGDKDTIIEQIKQRWRDILVDVPNEQWQKGHLDPTIPESLNNLAYQPPIQAKYKNRFKWDNMFQQMWPTGKELIPKINDYYTEIEQRDIYATLKKKFESDL